MAKERQIEKLKRIAAKEMVLTKHELFIKGEDLTFWSKPTTIDEYNLATNACKNKTDQIEQTARLFINKALDKSGQPQYQADALPWLTGQLSLKTTTRILQQLEVEVEEEEELDMKSDQEGSEEG